MSKQEKVKVVYDNHYHSRQIHHSPTAHFYDNKSFLFSAFGVYRATEWVNTFKVTLLRGSTLENFLFAKFFVIICQINLRRVYKEL